MKIKWEKVNNQLIWDIVMHNGLTDLHKNERIEVYYDRKEGEIITVFIRDGVHLNIDNPNRFVFIHSFDNLERYWEKKKKEIVISKKMQKKIDKEWFAWYDFVLGIYLADWMKTKIPELRDLVKENSYEGR